MAAPCPAFSNQKGDHTGRPLSFPLYILLHTRYTSDAPLLSEASSPCVVRLRITPRSGVFRFQELPHDPDGFRSVRRRVMPQMRAQGLQNGIQRFGNILVSHCAPCLHAAGNLRS